MIQEKVRLGEALTLPPQWQDTLHTADGDELTVLYQEDGILIIKDLGNVDELLRALFDMVSRTRDRDEYRARIAEMAAEYELSGLVQLAAEYEGPDEPMSPELEALYLEAEREVHESHLPPLCDGMTVELLPKFVEQSQRKPNE